MPLSFPAVIIVVFTRQSPKSERSRVASIAFKVMLRRDSRQRCLFSLKKLWKQIAFGTETVFALLEREKTGAQRDMHPKS